MNKYIVIYIILISHISCSTKYYHKDHDLEYILASQNKIFGIDYLNKNQSNLKYHKAIRLICMPTNERILLQEIFYNDTEAVYFQKFSNRKIDLFGDYHYLNKKTNGYFSDSEFMNLYSDVRFSSHTSKTTSKDILSNLNDVELSIHKYTPEYNRKYLILHGVAYSFEIINTKYYYYHHYCFIQYEKERILINKIRRFRLYSGNHIV
jgi:hypothetical protein